MTEAPANWPAEGERLFIPTDSGCIGCSPTNPHGMRLPFWREGNAIVGKYTAPGHFAGGPKLVHGGIIALLLDEYSCAAAYFLGGQLVVTGSLNVRYERPVPVERELFARAEITAQTHPKYWEAACTISLDDEVVARSTGRFFPIPEQP